MGFEEGHGAQEQGDEEGADEDFLHGLGEMALRLVNPGGKGERLNSSDFGFPRGGSCWIFDQTCDRYPAFSSLFWGSL
jgi:hypothetical protein